MEGRASPAADALGEAFTHGGDSYALGHQLVAQLAAVAVAVAWSAGGSALCFAAVKW